MLDLCFEGSVAIRRVGPNPWAASFWVHVVSTSALQAHSFVARLVLVDKSFDLIIPWTRDGDEILSWQLPPWCLEDSSILDSATIDPGFGPVHCLDFWASFFPDLAA